MNYTINPQCSFCNDINRYNDFNQRDRSLYQLKPYSNFHERPLLYCYDMTQRPVQDNYITYCNLVNNFPSDNEPQYVQVIDSNVSRGQVQFCVASNNTNLIPPIQRNLYNKRGIERIDNNCGVVLCTCNDFINSNLQNRIIYDTLPRRDVQQEYPPSNSKIQTVSQFSPNKDSIDSRDKSVDDQQENSIYSNGSLVSDPMCRFCHLSKNTQQDQLISPCYCCGTLKYVHQSCLKTWLEVSKKQRENSGNKSPHCELCNFKYVRKRKFQFGKIRQPKLSQNDCALHLIFLCSLLVMVTSASVTILCFAMEKSSSTGNRVQAFDPKLAESHMKFNDRKSTDISKNGNLLCEYLSNLSLKDYSISHRQSASKWSVICDLVMNKNPRMKNKISESNAYLPELPIKATTSSSIDTGDGTGASIWKKDFYQKVLNKPGSYGHSNGVVGQNGGRAWLLTPEEAVTLASGVIFFIAFFIAMVVQVKSSYTCYQLAMHWIRLNYTHEVQSLQQSRKAPSVAKDGANSKSDIGAAPREYIERCVTEI